MARQYQSVPPTQSFGHQYPNRPGQPSGPPPSFKTNVNRAKTKRWVEAKSYSYDGDDWGEADEYDEYGNYEEPSQTGSQEPSRPMGLRQQGQSTAASASGYAQHGRNNSFDEGEERRQFSTGAPPPHQQENSRSVSGQEQPPQPGFQQGYPDVGGPAPTQTYPEREIPIQQQQQYGLPSGYSQGHPSIDSPGGAQNQQGRPTFDGQAGSPSGHPVYPQGRPSMDGQQRPFTPGYPPPGNYQGAQYPDPSRGSGSRSQSMTSNVSSSDFQARRDFSPTAMPPPLSTRGSPAPPNLSHPPRKSSLSQVSSPTDFVPPQRDFPIPRQPDEAPQTRSERADSSSSAKPLPFVRPADIYRRMQEEREKERQSQDSSRPSMDAILGEQPPIPENAAHDIGHSSDKPLAMENRERSNSQAGSEPGTRRNVPALDPITERSPHGSPLLPEVARMSGFGDSFLGSTGLENAGPDLPSGSNEMPSENTAPDTMATDLQHQNSLGFRSVVQQAFDRPEDLNPISPTSASSSNIARTNSESTNAVSPIISRASSNAHSEARARAEANRDATVPSISEESGESPSRPGSHDAPSTPKGGRERSETQIYAPLPHEVSPPTFKPGHRRDMSTPSPDNSPARTPALEINRQVAEPQNVELATTTPVEPRNRGIFSDLGIPSDQRGTPHPTQTPSSRSDSPSKSRVRDMIGKLESPTKENYGSDRPDAMGLARPGTNRLESFRPQLPGGWDSFSGPSKQAPQISHSSGPGRADGENTLITKSKASPTPNEPRASTVKSTSRDGQIHEHPGDYSQTPDPFSSVTAAGTALANALVSAVGGKRQSSDPDSDSEPESPPVQRSRANTELRQEASRLLPPNPIESPVSSIAPTPLPKDTPMTETPATGHPDYFPPVVPLKQKPRGSVSPEPTTPNLIHSTILPSLSTENSPRDYESDRLRKELVRELSPSSGQFDRSRGSVPPVDNRPDSTPMGGQHHGHDSMGLPQEYESYWNDSTSEGRASRPVSDNRPHVNEPRTDDGFEGYSPGERQSPNDPSIIQQSDRLQVQQPELAHRFSWEELPEEISTSREASAEPTLPTRVDSNMKNLPLPPRPKSYDSSASQPSFGSGLAVAKLATASDNDSPQSEKFSHPLVKTGTNLQTRLTTDSNQSSQMLQQAPAARDFSGESGPSLQGSTVNAIPPTKSDPGKIIAFREIMAMKSSAERVRAFNETRQQFAGMNTGLSSWIAATLNDLPEHSNLLDNGGRFVVDGQKPSPSRGKLAGLRLSTNQIQQPYYQQYLDASGLSPTSTSTPSKQGQHSLPIYTPSSSGTKLTTRQVQAKGKDLLHGAGVFKGKANVVAKGLFSKGKSKLRGSDKALPPTPRVEPRSPRFSFGMQGRSPSQPQPLPQTPISVKPNTTEVDSSTALPVTPAKPERPPVTETPKESLRLSQDVFAVPANVPLEMPAPATPPQESLNLDNAENDAGLLSPASTSSSNKTLTLASFRKNSWAHEQLPPTPLQNYKNMSLGQGDAKELPESPRELDESILEVAPPDLSQVETPPAVPVHTVPTLEREKIGTPQGENLETPKATAHDDIPDEPITMALDATPFSQSTESQASPRRSEDSEGTFKTAESGNGRGFGDDQGPRSMAQDSTRPSVDGSVVSDISDPGRSSPPNALQSDDVATHRTPSPVRTPRPFSFIQFGEPPRPSEGLSYGASYEDEISSQQRQAVPPSPMSPISPHQAQSQEPAQPQDASQSRKSVDHECVLGQEESQPNPDVPVHHDTSYDFGPQDQSFTKKPRPRSFSRPFQDQFSRIRQQPHIDEEVEKRISAEMASPYYTMQAPVDTAQPRKGPDPEPRTTSQRPSIANIDTVQKRSRTSGILKSFSISPKDPLQTEKFPNPQESADRPTLAPLNVEKKSRRGKLLRTLTGRSGSDTNNSRDDVPALPEKKTESGQNEPTRQDGRYGNAQAAQENANNATRTFKFQRGSTSGVAGEIGGKKRRFSGLGSLFSQSKQRQASVPVPTQAAHPWIAQQQQENQPTIPNRPLLHSRQGSAAQQNAPPGSAIYPPPNNDLSSGQEYSPPSETMYDRPPLEGYYSPDRRSGNFSPAFISGQRSPRLGPQQFPPQPQYPDDARQHRPSASVDARRQNRISWQDGLPPASMNSPMYNSNSPTFSAGQNHGQYLAQRSNSYGSNVDPHPSWTRIPGQNDVPPLPALSQPPYHSQPPDPARPVTYQPRSPLASYSLYPSLNTNPTHQRSVSSSSRGFHEIDTPSDPPLAPQGTHESAPPPPPKDAHGATNQPRTSADLHPRHPAYQAYNQNSLAQSPPPQAPFHAQQPLTNANDNRQQALPSLQTNFSSPMQAVANGTPKQLTPEEVRRARQSEIERGIASPKDDPGNSGGVVGKTDENVVSPGFRATIGVGSGTSGGLSKKSVGGEMEADNRTFGMTGASYPGQEWTPGYGNWDGD